MTVSPMHSWLSAISTGVVSSRSPVLRNILMSVAIHFISFASVAYVICDFIASCSGWVVPDGTRNLVTLG